VGSDPGMGELLADLVRFAEAHREPRAGREEGGEEPAATERLLARRATVSDLVVYGRARGWSLAKCLHLLALVERLHRLVVRGGGSGALLGELHPGTLYPWELFDPTDVEANRAVRWSIVMPWKDRLEGDMARTLYLTAARLLQREEPWDRDVLVVRDRLLGLIADLAVVCQDLKEVSADLQSLGAGDQVLGALTVDAGRIGAVVPDLQQALRWLNGEMAKAEAAGGEAHGAS
jgi:hypothetical protein